MIYLHYQHNSVLGIREYASLAKAATTVYTDVDTLLAAETPKMIPGAISLIVISAGTDLHLVDAKIQSAIFLVFDTH